MDAKRSDTCSICKEQFRDPRFLTCFHTFCLECLRTSVDKSQEEGKFPCPVCQYEITVSDDGVSGFQNNLYIDKDQGTEEECGVCGQRAITVCHDCEIPFCKLCTKHHRALPISQSHLLLSLEDSVEGKRLLSRKRFCDKHREEQLVFFCTRCNQVICRNCKRTSHEGHKAVDIPDVVEEARDQLAEIEHELIIYHQYIESSFEKTKQKHVNITTMLDKTKTLIDNAADKLVDMINTTRNEATAQVRGIEETKESVFMDVFCVYKQKRSFLQSQIDYVKTMLKDGLDCDIIITSTEMKGRMGHIKDEVSVPLNDFIETLSHSSVLFPPPTNVQFVFSAINDIIRYPLPKPPKSPITNVMHRSKILRSLCGKIKSITLTQLSRAWVVYEKFGIFYKNECKMSLCDFNQTEYVHHRYTSLVDFAKIRNDGIQQFIRKYMSENPDANISKADCSKLKKETPQQDVNEKGDTCWVDVQQRVVLIKLSNGTLTALTVSPFSDPGNQFLPCDVCWGLNDELYIADSGSNIVVVYSLTGGFLKALFIPGRYFTPSAVIVDSEGNLWIGETNGTLSVCKME